jgi:hypothetical protein
MISPEKKVDITNTIANLRRLDKDKLLLIDFGIGLLITQQQLVQEEQKKEDK